MANDIAKTSYDEERGNLATNCSQIFSKGPAITREFIGKVQRADLVNERKFVFGYEFKTRHIWVLAGLFLLFAFSLLGTITLWCTNYFDIIVKSNLELKNGSDSYESFIRPQARPFVKMHIFNYTNVEDFERGRAEKLHVQDIGPYVFLETIERVNPVFGDDGTLTFREKRSYKFLPELSNGNKQSDQLVVPNMPVLGTVSMVKDTFYFTRVTVSSVLKGLDAKPFLKLPAHRFIWGYDDSFFTLVKSVLSFQQELPFEKFGLLAPKNGTSPDLITVSTGRDDIETVGTIVRFNGQDKMNHWSTAECNRIDGTLGAFFSPQAIRSKGQINIYQKDLCRKFPFYFQEEVKIMGGSVPAYRYSPSPTVFADPEIEPTNQCFCQMNTGTCPPPGTMNATPCAYGPAYLSFPHFLHGDPSLQEAITGLEPDENKHSMYLDIHPTLGYTMAGYTRLQINMLVRTAFGIPQVDMFEDGTMLPIAWIDTGLDAEDLPDSVKDIIDKTSFTIPHVELALRYGCLLMSFMTLITIIMVIQGRLRSKRPIRTIPPFQRNISGLDALIQ